MRTTIQAYMCNDDNGGHTAYLRIPGSTIYVTKRFASELGAQRDMEAWIADCMGTTRVRFKPVSRARFAEQTAEVAAL
jgi:hypothetical protein